MYENVRFRVCCPAGGVLFELRAAGQYKTPEIFLFLYVFCTLKYSLKFCTSVNERPRSVYDYERWCTSVCWSMEVPFSQRTEMFFGEYLCAQYAFTLNRSAMVLCTEK